MLDLERRNVLVLGLGISGRSAALFCAARGARVVAADERPARELGDLEALRGHAEISAGRPFPDGADYDLVVPSPGVPPERWQSGARLAWGDVELAWRALAIPIIAVTGTNGKSTTALLVAAMLRAAGLRALAAGNVGTPALSLVGQPLDLAVLEVSSFQLEATDGFRPSVAVVLNLTPDHLDRHGSFDAYAAAKTRLLANQTPDDTAVLNRDDAGVWAMAGQTRAQVLPFRTRGPLERGAWLDASVAVLRPDDAPARRIPLDGMRLRGSHNRENALAALAATAAAGADPDKAAGALATFEALPHRAEVVAERDGVTFVDDSKATNPGAALRALGGFSGPLVWIAGGRAKGLDLAPLAAEAARRVRAAVLIGEAADTLASVLEGAVTVARAASIEEAVTHAATLAEPGDVVLLAPGCSSHDQFGNFEERGERFRAAVEALGRVGAAS